MKLDCMDEELRQIHEASMQVLEKTGMKFHHPEIIELLQQKGIKVCGQTAYFTREQIIEWVSKAPSTFTLYARNPQYDIVVGGDNVECCPGSGSPAISDSDGSKRSSLMTDYVNFLKLYHQSDLYKVNGGFVVQPTDITSKHCISLMLYATILYSDKGIITATGGVEEVQALMDILAIVFGQEEWAQKPRAITIVNTNTPLQFDKNMLETMMVFVKHAQPVIIAAASMAGTTAPITLAGTIALTNAEVLAGIAVTQMLSEGAPVVYGSQTTTSDMRTGCIAIGSPEGALCYEYAARLAKAYGLPCRGGGSLTDSKSLSVQAGYESMLTHLATHRARMNLIFQSAGIMDGYSSMSYEKFVVDLEIIRMVKRYLEGVKVNPTTLAVDVIHEVGIAGHFLTAEHTMKHCRKEPFIPEISLRGTVMGDPSEALLEKIRNKKEKMLTTYQRPEFSPEIQQQLVDYLVTKGFDAKYIESLQHME
ncbi:trimethylamine methyltransferase family protein [Sporomusa malonica]|uniref:Methyltransferase n=1 Tax=Sporomusa malonica TaxID=112901 RepID=A0A1W2EQ49_9FIRM|nr:trimethylamine methyltransferase family protein [Sporomusa malonica]SMD11810.1 trimethylamine---corrinoid protein Co-methyltransferase [Sporomusa malonica]